MIPGSIRTKRHHPPSIYRSPGHYLRRPCGGYRTPNCKEEWFRLELPNGIPSHDTFGDVFARLDPEQFHAVLLSGSKRWPNSPKAAIDGDGAAPGTLGKQAIHMVNVWASANGLAFQGGREIQ